MVSTRYPRAVRASSRFRTIPVILLFAGDLLASMSLQAQEQLVWLKCDFFQNKTNWTNGIPVFIPIDSAHSRVGNYNPDTREIDWSPATFSDTEVTWSGEDNVGQWTSTIHRQTLEYRSGDRGSVHGWHAQCHKVASPTAENQF